MNIKKTYKQLLKETFTKTRDERYAESSARGKIAYWIFITIIISAIIYILFLR